MMQSILIVDDSKMSRMIIRRCLEMVGVDDACFVEAPNGKEALSELDAHEIDLVLADVNMPEMDGKALLKWMRSSEKLKDIPLIFITSTDNPAQLRELESLGAKAVLPKPLSPASLEPALGDLLAKE